MDGLVQVNSLKKWRVIETVDALLGLSFTSARSKSGRHLQIADALRVASMR
jgi:hypothetical protein